MNYEVVWTPDAENDLAAIWLAAPDRLAVSLASHRIELELAHSPLSAGESRTSSVNRMTWDAPLGVAFEVIEDDKRVYVHAAFFIQ